MSPSPKPLEVFCDRSLGRYQVPDALRAIGWEVHTMAEVYGEAQAQRLPDSQWLADAGAQDWVVLHKDAAIARLRHGRPGPELAALILAKVRAFCLMSGQLTGTEQAARFIGERRSIEQIALANPGPYVYGLYTKYMRRVWP
ncbi:MAG: hypothetical protein ACRENY_04590 [Candidatus Dormibacteria bacterium]